MSIIHSKAPPLLWYSVLNGNTAMLTSSATIITNTPELKFVADGTLPAPYTSVQQLASSPVWRPTRVGINGLSAFTLGFRALRLTGTLSTITVVTLRAYGRIPGSPRWFPHASTITVGLGATTTGEYGSCASVASMMYPEMFFMLEARTQGGAAPTENWRFDFVVTE